MKKVKFYVVLVAFLGAAPAMAAEIDLPIAKVQQELSEKAEQAVAQKLRECKQEVREDGDVPRYPVRIAEMHHSIGGPIVAGMSAAAP
ncbi:hypothetical protein [Microbulbifer yueqingensis]|uniref:hypothetical protein n=1 Tax=Microbulbifer yueqingensis TaxID=658219 RepID=UPI000B86CB57|nr:hypothetical protein [Microbulbifer yueqingensis]